MDIKTIILLIGEIATLVGAISPFIVWVKKITDAQKCQLRSEMLRIYYRNRETRQIRQFEYENFVFLFEAYKCLKGNSFIERINTEIREFEIIP